MPEPLMRPHLEAWAYRDFRSQHGDWPSRRRGDGDLRSTAPAIRGPVEGARHTGDPELTSPILIFSDTKGRRLLMSSLLLRLTLLERLPRPHDHKLAFVITAVSSYLDELEHQTHVKKQVI